MSRTWGCSSCGHAKAGHDERGCPGCDCRYVFTERCPVSADGTLRQQLEDWCWQRESANAGFHDGQRQAWAAGARPDLDDLAELVDAYAAQKAAEELRAAADELDGDGQGGFAQAVRILYAAETLRARAAALSPATDKEKR